MCRRRTPKPSWSAATRTAPATTASTTRATATTPRHYDLVLNTERLGFDGAADLIVHRARTLGWIALSRRPVGNSEGGTLRATVWDLEEGERT